MAGVRLRSGQTDALVESAVPYPRQRNPPITVRVEFWDEFVRKADARPVTVAWDPLRKLGSPLFRSFP